MAPASIIEKKAQEFAISISDPQGLGRLLVCQKMLEGINALLASSHTKVLPSMNDVEQELLEIKNEFEMIQIDKPRSIQLIDLRHVTSIDNIVTSIGTAYSWIFAATQIYEDKDGGIQMYQQISRGLTECRGAIQSALQCFLS